MSELIIHYPNFPIKENGEQDNLVYEHRLVYLREMIRRMFTDLVKIRDRHVFFHDVSVSPDEFNRCIQDCETCQQNKPLILSSILSDAHVTLKSQIHSLYFEDATCPSWYNKTLAHELAPHVLDGSTLFDSDTLMNCLRFMKWKYPQIRIKNGCGCAGTDQIVIGSLETPVPLRVLRNLDDCGVIVEKNLIGGKSYSFTSFEIFNTRFISVGLIMESDSGSLPGEKHYKGTTCIVMKEQDALLDIPGFEISDALFGKLTLVNTVANKLVSFGKSVSDVYRSVLEKNNVLPRLNFDVMFDDGVADDGNEGGRPVLIDTSLRVGGNTWNEFRGAYRLLKYGMKMTVQSIRILDSQEMPIIESNYKDLYNNLHIIVDGKQDTFMFGIDH